MLVVDRQAISERVARSMPVLHRDRLAAVYCSHVIMGGRRRWSRPRDYVHTFCATEGNLFICDKGTSE